MLNTPSLNTAQKTEAAILNNAVYIDYYKRLRLLALSMFEWSGLPDSMDSRFLEKVLYENGLACFCYDDSLGWLSLRCLPSDYLNVYDLANRYKAYGTGYEKTFEKDSIVLVRNNLDEIPTINTIHLFAMRLFEAERSIEVNVKAQKTPVLIKCSDKQRLTLKNVYAKYEGNEPVIFGDKDLDVEEFTVLKTDAPFIADKLTEYKRNIWSEALSFLGVNNVPAEKGERLLKDEVNSNNQLIQLSAETMLLTRKKAAEEFNSKFGFNVSVKLRSYEEFSRAENFENEYTGGFEE